jgi:hypothetical protein
MTKACIVRYNVNCVSHVRLSDTWKLFYSTFVGHWYPRHWNAVEPTRWNASLTSRAAVFQCMEYQRTTKVRQHFLIFYFFQSVSRQNTVNMGIPLITGLDEWIIYPLNLKMKKWSVNLCTGLNCLTVCSVGGCLWTQCGLLSYLMVKFLYQLSFSGISFSRPPPIKSAVSKPRRNVWFVIVVDFYGCFDISKPIGLHMARRFNI